MQAYTQQAYAGRRRAVHFIVGAVHDNRCVSGALLRFALPVMQRCFAAGGQRHPV